MREKPNSKIEGWVYFPTPDSGGGRLRDPGRSFLPRPEDPSVSSRLVEELDLVPGTRVEGECEDLLPSPRLTAVEALCGLSPAEFRNRPRLDHLPVVLPCEPFDLGGSEDLTARALGWLAPLGKGSRGIVASPPKAGKTLLLESLAKGILASDPNVRVIVFLIDERPEEVTQFRRAVEAEVIASTNDQSPAEHVDLAEKMLAQAEVELECGHDVVILLDSLTRMARAFNHEGSGQGHLIEGVLEREALEIPKRFFQLARKIEGGGSVTVVATALIHTGSNLDDLIYEEFRHQASTEIILERHLAERRLFPALNLRLTQTHREETLLPPGECEVLGRLRRQLFDLPAAEGLAALIQGLERFPRKEDFLRAVETGLVSPPR